MKTVKTVIFVLLSLFIFSGVNAEYRVYDNKEDFENDKGSVCESATDGCNTFFLTDGKVMGGTEMYCNNHKVEWTCKKYKDDVITTRTLKPTTTSVDNNIACTMEYDPVCGVDGKTYGNSCSATNFGKVDINYKGACNEKKELGENDENFYNTIKDKLDTKFQNIINKAVIKYEKKLSKYGVDEKIKINKKIIKIVEDKIFSILSDYPADISLPKDVNNRYLTYSFLKLELMKISFE